MPRSIARVLTVGLILSLWWSPAARSAVWQSIGPDDGGGVVSLAFAASDPHIVYAGSQAGDVFRSSDGGASWTAVSSSLGFSSVLCLAVDPRNPMTVYAGVFGDLYKSNFGGAAWQPLHLPSSGFPLVSTVRIDPVHPRIVYAVTNTGIFRTANGGDRWVERDAGLSGTVSAFELDADHPGTLYAGVTGIPGAPPEAPKLYKSVDGGGSWTALPGLRTSYVLALARQPSTDTLYASTLEGLFASRDEGATWAPLFPEALDLLVAAPSGTLYGSGRATGLVSSVDGGRTWNDPAPSSPLGPDGPVSALALDRTGDHLLASNGFAGVSLLTAGAGWSPASRGLRTAIITGLVISPASPSRLFISMDVRGVLVSEDGGASFSARNTGISLNVAPGTVFATALAANPRSPGSLAVGLTQGSIAHTSDGGLHWTTVTPTETCLPVDALAWASPSILFIASRAGVEGKPCTSAGSCTAKVSRDGGSTFACLDGPQDVSAFLVDPLRPAIIYAAAGDALWKSTDRGVHFSLVVSDPGMSITALAASPAAHLTLYAGGTQGLLKSIDGGASWSPTSLRTAVVSLLVDPVSPAHVYVGGDFIYESWDGGASWNRLWEGFPVGSPALVLALDSARHVLYAGTFGSGLWALPLP